MSTHMHICHQDVVEHDEASHASYKYFSTTAFCKLNDFAESKRPESCSTTSDDAV